jgi:type IV pilus assembly protein PilC
VITFKYIARDGSGNLLEGYTEAVSEAEVLARLRDQNCTPVVVEATYKETRKKKALTLPSRIKSGELAAVFWQLNAMVEGGITMAEALEGIAEDMENASFQKILLKILENIERGGSVSNSLAEFPQVFNKLVCSLIMAGETGGNIAAAFQRTAIYYTERDRIQRKVKKALAYPIFVMAFVVVVVTVIMTLVIPRFKDIFDSFGQGQLPAFTRAFMGFYDLFAGNWYYIIGALAIGIIMIVVLYRKSPSVHKMFSALFLRMPLFGNLLKYAFLATFCKTMSNLLRSGVPVLEAFEIVTETNNNDIITDKLLKTREGIVGGLSICASMTATNFFPNMTLKMVKAGEESGSLWRTLERTADYYEEKVDATIAMMTSLLEPLMIIIVGAIVLTVVLALYLPIFQLSDIQTTGAGV